MIYVPVIHMLLRGHWFVPELGPMDKYHFDTYEGCELCKLLDYSRYMGDRHRNGICPKQLSGQYCSGANINGIVHAECDND